MALGLLVLRVVIGLTLAAHGSQKLFGWFGGHGIAGTGGFFESTLGFRPGRFHATLAGLAELGGGVLLTLGLLTPVGAAAVIGVMMVAGWAAHGSKGFFMTNGGFEYPFILGVAAFVIACAGPGALALDQLLLGWHLEGAAWGCFALVLGAVAGAISLGSRRAEDEPDIVEGEATTVMARSDNESAAEETRPARW